MIDWYDIHLTLKDLETDRLSFSHREKILHASRYAVDMLNTIDWSQSDFKPRTYFKTTFNRQIEEKGGYPYKYSQEIFSQNNILWFKKLLTNNILWFKKLLTYENIEIGFSSGEMYHKRQTAMLLSFIHTNIDEDENEKIWEKNLSASDEAAILMDVGF